MFSYSQKYIGEFESLEDIETTLNILGNLACIPEQGVFQYNGFTWSKNEQCSILYFALKPAIKIGR